MAKQVNLTVVATLSGEMLLDIFVKFIAMAGHDELGISEVIALEDRLANAASVIVVDCVDDVIEDDQRALNALALGEQNRQTQASNMAFTEDSKSIDADLRVASERDLDFLLGG